MISEPITKAEAQARGLVQWSTEFLPGEDWLLQKMFAERQHYDPDSAVVKHGSFRFIYASRFVIAKKSPSPKQMRGNFPTVKKVVGQA